MRRPKIKIDRKARMGYIYMDGGKGKTMVKRTIEVTPNLRVDIGWLGQVIGIEFDA
jgi:uncharacterized protein YuzE